MNMALTDAVVQRERPRVAALYRECQKFAILAMHEMDEASDALRRAEHAYDRAQALLWYSEDELGRALDEASELGMVDPQNGTFVG